MSPAAFSNMYPFFFFLVREGALIEKYVCLRKNKGHELTLWWVPAGRNQASFVKMSLSES